MALDIVEIALDYLTDDQLFEKLSIEILYNEGYYDIKPLIGGNEFGQDAIQDKFYSLDNIIRSVFQVSFQEYVKGKIKKTIKRLKECKIDFTELVYVTQREILGEEQEKLKKEFRIDEKVILTFVEKHTFINRLSDYSNGIFYRYFPDIETQILSLKSSKPIIHEDVSQELEMSLLKVSIAFTFNKEAHKTRKDVFDHLIISLMCSSGNRGLTIEEIINSYKNLIDKNFNQESQIRASLNRLKTEKLIEEKKFLFSVTSTAKVNIETRTIQANKLTEQFLIDIVKNISSISKSSYSKEEIGRIKRNILNILVELFKFYGLELSNRFIESDHKTFEVVQKEHFVNIAKIGLNDKIGELLVSVLGDVLMNPTETQATIISNWGKSFLGVKIMNLDPNLKELQYSQMSKKVFFLDTDFLLECLVTEKPIHNQYINILNKLLSLGCKLIIPTKVFDECIKHAAISYRTYTYFGEAIHNLSEEIVEYEVNNNFVKGYYYYCKSHPYISYNAFLNNYYDKNNPISFFTDILKEKLPNGIYIEDINKFTVQIPEDIFEKFKKNRKETLLKKSKAKYRSPDETEELAINDSKLFLTCYFLNQKEPNSGRILGGKAYLLTLSMSYSRCAKEIGISDIVTAKPQSISSILDIIGKTEINPVEFVKLMDNPLLSYSIEKCWPDVEILMRSGIKLNDKSLSRLRWDLEETLHNHIMFYNTSTSGDNRDKVDTIAKDSKLESFINLINEAKKLGYRNLPEIDIFLKEIENKENISSENENKYKQTVSQYETLKNEIERFGRRKQNYLNKISRPKK